MTRRDTGTRAAGPRWVRRHGPLLAGAAGVLTLAAAVYLGWRDDRPVREFGAAPPATAAPSVTPPAIAAPPPAREPAVRPLPPQRLAIPAIGVDAAVRLTGIDKTTGEVDVPRDVNTVGWYRFGPDLATRAGSIVIAGHVDSAEQGRGAFFRLRDLQPGDRATVTGADGRARTYTVDSRRVYAKSSAPLDRLFARDGPPRLTLITCGGAFERRTGHYRDNVVVTAAPA